MSSTTSNPAAPTIPTATGPDPAVMEAIERGNAVVFFDVALGEGPAAPVLGRIKLELFVKDVGIPFCCRLGLYEHLTITLFHFFAQCPKTCENFRQVGCTRAY